MDSLPIEERAFIEEISSSKRVDSMFLEKEGSEGNPSSDIEERLRKLISEETEDNSVCCKLCKDVFVDSYHLMKHFLDSHGDIESLISGDGNDDKVHTKPQCSVCKRNFYNLGNLKHHMKRIHSVNMEFTCEDCGKKFLLFRELKRHQVIHSSESSARYKNAHFDGKSLVCNPCGSRFDSVEDLSEHQLTQCDVRKHICQICQKGFKQAGHLNVHMVTHTGERNFKCEICGTQFGHQSTLRNHMVRHQEKKEKKCQLCKKCFENLEEHQKEEHNGDKPFHCQFCPQTFTWVQSLKRHEAVHKLEEKQCCPVCNKEFLYSDSLRQHMRIHTGIKPFVCTICTKAFSWRDSLTSHMRSHMERKPFSCEVCDKSFVSTEKLQSHRTIHNSQISCQICDGRFRTPTHLRNHMRTHTGEKPFSCHLCDKKFAVGSGLKSHLRTHTGEKPFSCNICNKNYFDSSSLRKHRRSQHKDVKESEFPETCHRRRLRPKENKGKKIKKSITNEPTEATAKDQEETNDKDSTKDESTEDESSEEELKSEGDQKNKELSEEYRNSPLSLESSDFMKDEHISECRQDIKDPSRISEDHVL